MVNRLKSFSLLVGISLVSLLATGLAPQDDPLRVDARVASATYYAGQAIEVRVSVVAERDRPMVFPPKLDRAEVAKLDESFRQIAASGIGDFVTETNLFLTRFRVIPTAPGPLVIPPFHARIDGRSGASKPIRLVIRPVPLDGRPPSYLRGVGRLRARAEAVPTSVRVGQTIDYRLILEGPGARGSTQWPLLSEFESIKGLEIKTAGTDVVSDPPSRIDHVKIRPTVPGDLSLPSVAVATFDPDLGRYVETRTPSVLVKVVDVPRFDPASLDASLPKVEPESLIRRLIRAIATALLMIPVMLGLMILIAMIGTGPRGSAKRYAKELRAWSDPSSMVGRITSGLESYLFIVFGKKFGHLTPPEAIREIDRAVGDKALADRAGRLIERCDRAQFGLDPEAVSGLAAEAADFFEELGKRRVRRRWRPSGGFRRKREND